MPKGVLQHGEAPTSLLGGRPLFGGHLCPIYCEFSLWSRVSLHSEPSTLLWPDAPVVTGVHSKAPVAYFPRTCRVQGTVQDGTGAGAQSRDHPHTTDMPEFSLQSPLPSGFSRHVKVTLSDQRAFSCDVRSVPGQPESSGTHQSWFSQVGAPEGEELGPGDGHTGDKVDFCHQIRLVTISVLREGPLWLLQTRQQRRSGESARQGWGAPVRCSPSTPAVPR